MKSVCICGHSAEDHGSATFMFHCGRPNCGCKSYEERWTAPDHRSHIHPHVEVAARRIVDPVCVECGQPILPDEPRSWKREHGRIGAPSSEITGVVSPKVYAHDVCPNIETGRVPLDMPHPFLGFKVRR